MTLKIIMVNKRSPIQKTLYCIIPFIRSMKNGKDSYRSLNTPSLGRRDGLEKSQGLWDVPSRDPPPGTGYGLEMNASQCTLISLQFGKISHSQWTFYFSSFRKPSKI